MELVADDDIDTQKLQNQINMSISFAEDLVSSWIKPAHKANLSESAVDAQKLLDEQLRRPPRLGVGAPMPESFAMAHDTARLKQLIIKGKKRSPEDLTTSKLVHESEDEESRGGRIKKKKKLDAFAGRSKTKANSIVNSVKQSTHNQTSPHRHTDVGDSMTGGDDQKKDHVGHSIYSLIGTSNINSDSSTIKRKKRRRKDSVTRREASTNCQEQAIPQSMSQTLQSIITSPYRSGHNESLFVEPPLVGSELSSISFSIPGPFSISALQTEIKRHEELNVAGLSKQCAVQPPCTLQKARVLCFTAPLLNLDGPSVQRDGTGKDDGDGPKKKRKRRKRRKHCCTND